MVSFVFLSLTVFASIASANHATPVARHQAPPEWVFTDAKKTQPDGKIVNDQVTVTYTKAAGGTFTRPTFTFKAKFSDSEYAIDARYSDSPVIKANGDKEWHIPSTTSGKGWQSDAVVVEKAGAAKEKIVTMLRSNPIREDGKNIKSRKVTFLRVSSSGDLIEAEMVFVDNIPKQLRVLRTSGNAFGFRWPASGNGLHHQTPRSMSITPPTLPRDLSSVPYNFYGTSSRRRSQARDEMRLISHLLDLEVAAPQPAP